MVPLSKPIIRTWFSNWYYSCFGSPYVETLNVENNKYRMYLTSKTRMTYNTISELICKSFVMRRLLNLDHFVCPLTVDGMAYPNVFWPISEPQRQDKKSLWLMFTSYSLCLFYLSELTDCSNSFLFYYGSRQTATGNRR